MITADQHTVADVLGDAFLHEIPPYQRPYAWTPEHALQLFDDLREAIQSGEDEPYFLGSIVLIKPLGQNVGQVVDGQQRLTTLTILAAVLRDVATDIRGYLVRRFFATYVTRFATCCQDLDDDLANMKHRSR